MLEFTDTPYEFFPPNPSPVLIRLARFVNRTISLPSRNHRIKSLDLLLRDRIDAIKAKPDARILFLANHSTHSDPQIIAEVQRQCGVVSSFMAAYDVFQRGKLTEWLMQRTGCFSVDRDSSDRESLKTAVAILADGAYALTIFPEGNVYFTNDKPAPFMEGAAFIAMRAQKKLGTNGSVYVVPISIKATHVTDQRSIIRERIASVAAEMGTAVDPEQQLIEEFKRVGMLAMERNMKQRGILHSESEGTLADHVRESAGQILDGLEQKMGLQPKDRADLVDRLRRVRSTIHQIRTDADREAEHEEAACWADEAILAMRFLGYSDTYLADHPTLDRFGETTERFMEDVYSRMFRPYGDRHAFALVNEPINLTDVIEQCGKNSRKTIESLNNAFEAAVQMGLDEINDQNTYPGGELF